MTILRSMDDVPLKYIFNNVIKKKEILNEMENTAGKDNNYKFEKLGMKERKFFQNKFDILNPPNI